MGLFSKKKKPEEAEKKKPGEAGGQENEESRKGKKSDDEVKMADLYAGKKTPTVKKDATDKKKKEGGSQKTAKPVKGDTGNAYKVIIKPVVSEKASLLGQYNKYIFEVASEANKVEVKKAIQSLYGVEPIKVNIVKVSGKKVRYGKVRGKTKNWKKAIITLKPGQSIQVYEGV